MRTPFLRAVAALIFLHKTGTLPGHRRVRVRCGRPYATGPTAGDRRLRLGCGRRVGALLGPARARAPGLGGLAALARARAGIVARGLRRISSLVVGLSTVARVMRWPDRQKIEFMAAAVFPLAFAPAVVCPFRTGCAAMRCIARRRVEPGIGGGRSAAGPESERCAPFDGVRARCPECGATWIAGLERRANAIYCSHRCRTRGWRRHNRSALPSP